MHTPAIEIVAHRGASHELPENTISSFKRAWQDNADAVELDIHLTKDGKIVVIHDSNTLRTAGREGKVSEMTFEEIRALDAGAWKGSEFSNEKIPTLDEVLALKPEGKRMYIEVKCGTEIIPELINTLQRAQRPMKDIAIISFDLAVLQEAKKKIPQVSALWLRAYDPNVETSAAYREFIRCCREAKLDGLDLEYKWPLDEKWMKEFRNAGLKILAWTVDDPEVARQLVTLGADGITTNRSRWLRGQLKN